MVHSRGLCILYWAACVQFSYKNTIANATLCTCYLRRSVLLLFQVGLQGSRCNQLKAKVFYSLISSYSIWPDPNVCSAAAIFNPQCSTKVSEYIATGLREVSHYKLPLSNVSPRPVCFFFSSHATYLEAKTAADERCFSHFLILVLARHVPARRCGTRWHRCQISYQLPRLLKPESPLYPSQTGNILLFCIERCTWSPYMDYMKEG